MVKRRKHFGNHVRSQSRFLLTPASFNLESDGSVLTREWVGKEAGQMAGSPGTQGVSVDRSVQHLIQQA